MGDAPLSFRSSGAASGQLVGFLGGSEPDVPRRLQKGALVRVVLHLRVRAFYSVNPSLLVLLTSSVALQISASMGSSQAEGENDSKLGFQVLCTRGME